MPPLPPNSYASPGSSKAAYAVERLAGCNHTELVRFARLVQDRCADRDLEVLLTEIDWTGRAGVAGAPKNMIFAADGPKPDLILPDAVNTTFASSATPSTASSTTSRSTLTPACRSRC
jgi:hypothetical protein